MTINQDQLLGYFEGHFNVSSDEIEADTLLFSSGLIDSFNMIELIMFIEETCETAIKPSEINLDNLDSVGRIMAFLEKRNN